MRAATFLNASDYPLRGLPVLPISYRSPVPLKVAGMISALTCRAASIHSPVSH